MCIFIAIFSTDSIKLNYDKFTLSRLKYYHKHNPNYMKIIFIQSVDIILYIL